MEVTFLTDLGVSEENATKIIAQADSEIKAAEGSLTEQLNAANQQIADANKLIEGFKGMDIDAIKNEAEDWKNKFEAAEAEKESIRHAHRIDSYVKKLGLKDDIYEAHVTRQLLDAQLKFSEDGALIGGDQIVGKFREAYPNAFSDANHEGTPYFAGSPGNSGTDTLSGVEKAFYEKNPDLK